MRYFCYKLLQNYVHRGYQQQTQILLHELELHILNLPSGTDLSVLELACGDGNLASAFSPNVYLGIDVVAERIQAARRLYPDYRFELADVNSAGFRNLLKDFNFIFCHGLLHHLNDQQCQELLSSIQSRAKQTTTFIALEPLLPVPWRNPLGFILAKIDQGAYVRSPEAYRLLFGNSLVRVKWFGQFPRWPVSEEAYTLKFLDGAKDGS